jgi:hypothetical protein
MMEAENNSETNFWSQIIALEDFFSAVITLR